ncbi:MAG: AAA family ATPase [Planctomycetota bacterium]|nr:AAA family ATPase [Planctomycetota bacterium]
MKRLYVTATKMNDGKTLISLGLMAFFAEKFNKVGYIKPLGLKDVRAPGYEVDGDALLMARTHRIHAHIQDMSPVTVDRDSIKEYFEEKKQKELLENVKEAFERVARDKDFVLIEGTGHAGVGSIFGLPNARVAKELGAKVLLVTSGGIGHPLDEVALNVGFFKGYGVEVIGVVFNKVRSHEFETVKTICAPVLERFGTRLLGVVPHNKGLDMPTMMEVLERTRGRLILGEKFLSNRIHSVQIGAMSAQGALARLRDNTLIVTGGDRADLLLSVIIRGLVSAEKLDIAGVVLTGGMLPSPEVLEVLKKMRFPVISVEEDSYTTTSLIKGIDLKISPSDESKISTAIDLVRRYVETEKILGLL